MSKAMFPHLSPLQSPKPLLDTFSLTHPPEILLHIYLYDVCISVFYIFSTFFFSPQEPMFAHLVVRWPTLRMHCLRHQFSKA